MCEGTTLCWTCDKKREERRAGPTCFFVVTATRRDANANANFLRDDGTNVFGGDFLDSRRERRETLCPAALEMSNTTRATKTTPKQ
jgi:hypothetical protein